MKLNVSIIHTTLVIKSSLRARRPPGGSEALHSLCTLRIRRTATAADAENTMSIMHETVPLIQRETQSRFINQTFLAFL